MTRTAFCPCTSADVLAGNALVEVQEHVEELHRVQERRGAVSQAQLLLQVKVVRKKILAWHRKLQAGGEPDSDKRDKAPGGEEGNSLSGRVVHLATIGGRGARPGVDLGGRRPWVGLGVAK